jgi:hypothetical protein
VTTKKLVEKITFILLGYGGTIFVCGLIVLPFNQVLPFYFFGAAMAVFFSGMVVGVFTARDQQTS